MQQTPESFRCPACGADFGSRQQLEQHSREAHPQPQRFRCTACGMDFATREQLEEHGRREHQR
jgi:uncharacterized C2H2 Zn-finger protein